MTHKHHDLIVKWAAGAQIESWDEGHWYTCPNPAWEEHVTYRVKPEPDIRWQWIMTINDVATISADFYKTADDASAEYPGWTVFKKAEWTRTDFSE